MVHAKQKQKGKMKEYENFVTLFCSTDMGHNAGFVFRKSIRAFFLSLFVVGRWLREDGDSEHQFFGCFL